MAETVTQHLGRDGAAALMTTDLEAAELAHVEMALRAGFADRQTVDLVEQADIRPGSLRLKLDARALASLLNLPEDRINPTTLTIDAPFQMRRRGVELKLHLGVASPEIDPVLVENIVKAKDWLAMIIDGKSFAEIAETAGTSKRRIQAVVELALLAPDILTKIATGEQPAALTSDYLIKTGFSAIWAEQRAQFANL